MQCITRGLLLQMLHVAWSVCLSVSVEHMGQLCRNGWTDWDAAWEADLSGSKNHVLDGGPDWTNSFTATSVTRRWCSLLPNYFGRLLLLLIDNIKTKTHILLLLNTCKHTARAIDNLQLSYGDSQHCTICTMKTSHANDTKLSLPNNIM